jgi:hypothetical protein
LGVKASPISGGIMKKLLKTSLGITALFGLLFLPADQVSSQISKSSFLIPVASNIKVTGQARISFRPTRTALGATIKLRVKGQPMVKRIVKVAGQLIPEVQPGVYRKNNIKFNPVPGKLIKVTIEHPARTARFSPRLQRTKGQMATAVVKVPVTFITPKPEAKIKLLSAKRLKISWNPGTGAGPVRIYIWEFTGPNSVANSATYQSGDIFTNSVSLTTKMFKPNRKYGIYIYRDMGNFKFKLRPAPGSMIKLGHSNATYIYTL